MIGVEWIYFKASLVSDCSSFVCVFISWSDKLLEPSFLSTLFSIIDWFSLAESVVFFLGGNFLVYITINEFSVRLIDLIVLFYNSIKDWLFLY